MHEHIAPGIYAVGRHQFKVEPNGQVRYWSQKRHTASRSVMAVIAGQRLTVTGNGLGLTPWLVELFDGHATPVPTAIGRRSA